MKLKLADVARTSAHMLAELPETDCWSGVRDQLRSIFGEDQGGTIADAVEATFITGEVSDVERLILDQLHARVESTFELRRLTAEFDPPRLGARKVRTGGGPVVKVCRNANAR